MNLWATVYIIGGLATVLVRFSDGDVKNYSLGPQLVGMVILFLLWPVFTVAMVLNKLRR